MVSAPESNDVEHLNLRGIKLGYFVDLSPCFRDCASSNGKLDLRILFAEHFPHIRFDVSFMIFWILRSRFCSGKWTWQKIIVDLVD